MPMLGAMYASIMRTGGPALVAAVPDEPPTAALAPRRPTLLSSAAPAGKKALLAKERGGKEGAEGRASRAALERVEEVCARVDADGDGWISKFDLVEAARRDDDVVGLLLPGAGSARDALRDEALFEALEAAFSAASRGGRRARVAALAAQLRGAPSAQEEPHDGDGGLMDAFFLADRDGDGLISKLDLAAAARQHSTVAALVHPGSGRGAADADVFDAAERAFEAASSGKRRLTFADFRAHFGAAEAAAAPRGASARPRGGVKVFLIDPCCAAPLSMLRQAGFQLHCCTRVPVRQAPSAPTAQQLAEIRAELEASRPDVLVCAGAAAVYVYGLWQAGWSGPTVLVNPATLCQRVPASSPVVLVAGGQDGAGRLRREDVERVAAASAASSKLLLHVVDPQTYCSSALGKHDCLPRLLDGVLSQDGPQAHVLRTWPELRAPERLEAERWLGYDLARLRRRWASAGQRGRDSQKLFAVPQDSEEFRQVSRAFYHGGKEAGAYPGKPGFASRIRIVKVERVENGLQTDGCTQPYYHALGSAVEDQGMTFEPGVHTTWAFHGSPEVDSIISNPMTGVQPLAAGTKSANLWGAGTYFARDAKYVVDGNFDRIGATPSPDGSRRIMMFLLMTGIPCLGDPGQKGVLPYRQAPHRFNSSVDSLSNPEIYVVQQSGAAHPGYVITIAPTTPGAQ